MPRRGSSAPPAGILHVAALAGVSPATVSRALRDQPGVSPDTRAAVRRAAAELGYAPSPAAATLSSGRTSSVGVLAASMTKWFFAAALDGAQQLFGEAGFDLVLQQVPSVRLARQVSALSKRMDGMLALCLPPELTGSGVDPTRLPIVVVGHRWAGAGSVMTDDRRVGELATSHLLELGHRDIAFVGGIENGRLAAGAAADRWAGYRATLRAARLRPRPASGTGWTIEDGMAGFERLWQRAGGSVAALPSAVFAVCDEVAMGIALAAKHRQVRVPEQLSVIGVDGHEIGAVIGLSTIRQPVHEMGRRAAAMLLTRLTAAAGVPQPANVPAQPWADVWAASTLVRRATTAPPR